MEHTLLLIRHGEIGLKSHAVRARFERALGQRLEQALLTRSAEALVTSSPARHYVEATDLEAAAEAVRHVFGITTFSPALRVSSGFEVIVEAAARYAERWWPMGAASFAIRPRRTGSHPYTSQEIGVEAGSSVYRAMEARGVPVRVDLDDPDFALTVEVRGKEAFLYHEKLPGPGGLPLGTQGRMVVHLDSGDAAAAAYLMMRRGAQVYAYYFPQVVGGRARPEATMEEDHPAKGLHAALLEWGAHKELRPWWLSKEDLAAATGEPLPDQGVPLARLALSAGIQLAARSKAQAVLTGETARSPWARRLPDTHVEGDIPVLRPLMGLSRPIIDDFREILGLPRQGGPRVEESERVYTAGGRRDVREKTEEPKGQTPEAHAWDPY